MTTRFEVIGEAPNFRLGACGPMIVSVYRGVVDLKALQQIDTRQTELLLRHPKLFSFAIVLSDGLAQPPPEVRQFAADLQGKYASRTTGAAIVVAVSGLAAVMARGFMVALSLIAPPTMNQKTFKTVQDAVEWARSIPNQVAEIAAPDLVEALEQFMQG